MRDPKRIEDMLNIIRNAWYEFPEARLCQLLSNIAVSNGWKSNDLFYLEDDILEEALKNFIKERKNVEKNT